MLRARRAIGAALVVAAAVQARGAAIDATWSGGDGAYEDPARWVFEPPPATALFPTNDAVDRFRVRIDGGNATASNVLLSGDVSIDALAIDAGDRLEVGAGAALRIVASSEPTRFQNDGSLVLDGSGAGSILAITGNLTLAGGGVLALGGAGSRIELGRNATLTNGAEHTLRGRGEIFLDQATLLNDGSIVADGAGPLQFAGGTLSNRGSIEIASGAALELDRVFRQSAPGASIRIDAGGELRSVSTVTVSAGTLRLDGGRVQAEQLQVGSFQNTAARLEGNGLIAAEELVSSSGAIVAPGGDGIGRIEIESPATGLGTGTLEIGLGGALPGESDRLDVSGGFSVQASDVTPRIDVSLLGGFTPARGDRFTLVNSQSFGFDFGGSLVDLFAVPNLGSDLFFVPDLVEAGGRVELQLAVAAPRTATWTGGSGDFGDAARWTFDTPAPPGTIPGTSRADLDSVRIDGGAAGTSSAVDLAAAVGLERLEIDAGDALRVVAGGRLGFVRASNRPEGGVVVNHGRIELSGGSLLVRDDLRLEGTGILQLSAGQGVLSPTTPDLFNGAGHTIRGAGTIEPRVVNDGLVESSGAAPLVLDRVTNRGTLRAGGAGGIELTFLEQNGSLEIGAGSRLRVTSTFRISQFGPDTLTRIGPGAVLDAAMLVSQGRVVLDGGQILRTLDFSPEARLEGSGSIGSGSTGYSILFGGTVAPGIGGAGTLEIRRLSAGGARFELELGGAGVDQYDRVLIQEDAILGARSIDLSLQGGFVPAPGDRFEIVRAGTLLLQTGGFATPAFPPSDLFASAPDLGADRVFVPAIVAGAGTQALSVSLAQRTGATWIGGTGDYATPGAWQFDAPPIGTQIAANDAANYFDVTIGDDASVADVTLRDAVTIGNLRVLAGDTLRLADGASLDLDQPIGAAPVGQIENDGLVALDGTFTGSGVAIASPKELTIRGAGLMQLSNGANNHIGSATTRIVHEAGHTIRGGGVIEASELVNRGTIEGSFLELRAKVLNEGTLRAGGTLGITRATALENRGQIEVDARLVAGIHQTSALAETLVSAGGVLEGAHRFDAGRLRLDGASVLGGVRVGGAASQALLEGSGSITQLTIAPNGTLAPGGMGAAGRIDVTGAFPFRFEGRYAFDLPGAGGGDVLAIAGPATLQRGRIEVSALPGFAASAGDTFELLRAASLVFPEQQPFAFFSQPPPALGGDLWLVPEIHPVTGGESLVLQAKQAVEATWDGGDGAFGADNWSYDDAGVAVPSPGNDAAHLFDVHIDAATPSRVTLGAPVVLDSLHVGDGDALVLEAGAQLTLAATPGRAASGILEDAGSIEAGAGARIAARGELRLGGDGVLELNAADGLFAGDQDLPMTLFQESGHTIRGSGALFEDVSGFHTFFDRGLVEATGSAPLALDAVVLNTGVLKATGAGGLQIASLDNRGRVEVAPASVLQSPAALVNFGSLSIASGAQASFAGVNQLGPDAALQVAGELHAGSALLRDGVLRLEGGRMVTTAPGPAGIQLDAPARIEGDGVVETSLDSSFGSTAALHVAGSVAPGLDGVGRIDLIGDLALQQDGRLELELAGSEAGEFDLLTVVGTSVLEGTILLALVGAQPGEDPFTPEAGDFFDVLVAGEIVDAGFRSVLPQLDPAFAWATEIVDLGDESALRYRVVPEPGTALLVALGTAALAGRRRCAARSRSSAR